MDTNKNFSICINEWNFKLLQNTIQNKVSGLIVMFPWRHHNYSNTSSIHCSNLVIYKSRFENNIKYFQV